MAYDGIVVNKISNELQFLKGSRIDKIFQPNNNEILIGMYNNQEHKNFTLLINIDSRNYRVHLTNYNKKNPVKAPNFCMVLRKHLLGLHLKNVITNNLERIIVFELEGLDDIDELINKKLVVELMGKHCNVIILDDQNVIIDSLRHINNESSTHIVVPHIKYKAPLINKKNILNVNSFEEFKDNLNISSYSLENLNLADLISNTYNGISKSQIQRIIDSEANRDNNSFNNDNSVNVNDDFDAINLKYVYDKLITLINSFDSTIFDINVYNNKKDYCLVINDSNDCNNYNVYNDKKSYDMFNLNYKLDKFYYEKETSEKIRDSKSNLLKLTNDVLKKYKKRLANIDKKLLDTKNMDKYKLYGELITANLYKLPKCKVDKVELENYYDNNSPISINLDIRYTPSDNAKKFFKKYNKLKNTIEICSVQKDETIEEINYLESVIYEINCLDSLDSLENIKNEINENISLTLNNYFDNTSTFHKQNINSKNNKNKKANKSEQSFSPLKFNVGNYCLLVGRNNKENDYLTTRYANGTDVWFHTKDIHGSHGILLVNKKDLSLIESTEYGILKEAASIVSYHSKAKDSSNVPVDYALVKYVKKPNGSKPGMVIYTNNKTIYCEPKNKETV